MALASIFGNFKKDYRMKVAKYHLSDLTTVIKFRRYYTHAYVAGDFC